MKMPWSLYLAQLNEAGKLTARSNMDMMIVILEVLEVMEEDIKDTKLLAQSTPLETIEKIKPEGVIGEEPKVEVPDVSKPPELKLQEPKA